MLALDRFVQLFFGGFDDRLSDFASTALGELLAFDVAKNAQGCSAAAILAGKTARVFSFSRLLSCLPSGMTGFRAQADLLQRELESVDTQALD